MCDSCYCQYAFVEPECRVHDIGSGVDPRFDVELIRDGPVAAVVSRVGLNQFDPERLQGKTAEDIQWLGKIAARHHEIICQAASSSAVLPLRLGTIFRSRDSLQAMLARCRSTVALFLQEIGNRREWGVKLYLEKRRPDPMSERAEPLLPLCFGPSRTGTAYLARKKAELESRREQRAGLLQTIQGVEQCLAGKAEHFCRIGNLPTDLTGRDEEMVFNAAFLLPSSARERWLETVQNVERNVHDKGLALELNGPWPPYHFCPDLKY